MSAPEIVLLVSFGWLGLSALACLIWIGLAELRIRRREHRQQRTADNAELHAIAEYIRYRRRVAAILARWAKEYGR